jgi:hypothetical protein
MRNDGTIVRWFLTANMNCLWAEKQLTEYSWTQALQLSPTHWIQVYKSFDGMLYPLSRAEQSHQMRNCSQQQEMGWMNPFPLARKKSWIFLSIWIWIAHASHKWIEVRPIFERFVGLASLNWVGEWWADCHWSCADYYVTPPPPPPRNYIFLLHLTRGKATVNQHPPVHHAG